MAIEIVIFQCVLHTDLAPELTCIHFTQARQQIGMLNDVIAYFGIVLLDKRDEQFSDIVATLIHDAHRVQDDITQSAVLVLHAPCPLFCFSIP